MKLLLLSVALVPMLLTGCADPEPTHKREPGGQAAGERLESSENSPTARPVTIGEGGARFAACQGRGRVGGLRGNLLPLREAPFDSAKAIGALSNDTDLYICTRSLDQQWLGVVIGAADTVPPENPPTVSDDAPVAAPMVDCGVTSPVRSERPYDGPCLSGWVENTFVVSVAN